MATHRHGFGNTPTVGNDRPIHFTVAIPTYNGEQRLPEVLERLRSQVGTESIAWEILVIDNNSQDRTAQVVQSYQVNFPYPIHYHLELQQGAGFARQRAVREAKGSLIGFLDDDNLPADTWVAEAVAFAQSHPQAGAYASQSHGQFETELPANFHRIVPFLAITERGSRPLKYHPAQKLLPPSAGLVVRRQVWLDTVPSELILGGRNGANGSMLTGEDLEVLLHIQQAGWDIWYNPRMEIIHKIPHWRLERTYLLSLFRGIGLSRWVTRRLSVKPWQRPFMLWAYFLNDLRKLLIKLIKSGKHWQTDVVVACEIELLISSLISPFYLYQHGHLHRKSIELPPLDAPVTSAYSQSL